MNRKDRIKFYAAMLAALSLLTVLPDEDWTTSGAVIYGAIMSALTIKLFATINEDQREKFAAIRPNSRKHHR